MLYINIKGNERRMGMEGGFVRINAGINVMLGWSEP
jgi:hypothetical protein